MAINIAPKIALPEGIRLREGAEIRLVFEVDLINPEHRELGLTVELWAQEQMGNRLPIGGTVNDIPKFDTFAMVTLQATQRGGTMSNFDAILLASADCYSRSHVFALRREGAGTEDDHFMIEMRIQDGTDAKVHASEIFDREDAVKYFDFA